MVLLPSLRYVLTFTGGIAFSTWVNRRVTKRRAAQAAINKTPNKEVASPKLFIDTANAHMGSAMLKAAVELNVFTAIAAVTRKGEAPPTAARVAEACRCSERGMRILLDVLTAEGFLVKSVSSRPMYTYKLTPSSGKYLDRASPSCLADSVSWFCGDDYVKPLWTGLVDSIVTGSATAATRETAEARRLTFARAMGPKTRSTAVKVAAAALARGGARDRILDVAAGHGMYGVLLATQHGSGRDNGHATSTLTAMDAAPLLAAAAPAAAAAGLRGARYAQLAGDPAALEWGYASYDCVIMANYLQTLGADAAAALLRKARAALAPGGRAYIVEALADEDRERGEGTLMALPLLALTRDGETRTFAEVHALCVAAGFAASEVVPLPNSTQTLVVAYQEAPAPDAGVGSVKGAGVVTAAQAGPAQVGDVALFGEAARRAAREDFPSPEETTWNYPMSLGDFFSLVERMVVSSITKNPFE
ncbi:S-adenosyl-L-methionine-dependent methyltransferase [Tribonema minus]|uniref:S-adenosyl-L-methionine-dependent methyltransferase n=1 Tax=Tribonema minus TaxID=303371 RepID=A0A835ZDP7_9STRA|nr:S-adenosyl-L-methionine-dependent methyltransferase [Tribonema minus]